MPNNDYILRSDAATLISQLPVYHGSDGAWVNQKDVLDTLNVIPAADVELVRRGRWIKVGRLIACSVCKENPPRTYHNFCPNCGAKMDAKPPEE